MMFVVLGMLIGNVGVYGDNGSACDCNSWRL